MELRQLRYFVKVAETLNFSEASKALFITQSTLSQQIKQLEQELGSPLFVRDSHKVGLTEAGSELFPMPVRLFSTLKSVSSAWLTLRSLLTGTLNIGVTYSFSPILTETILNFMKVYPGVRLNIFYKPMSELMEMLRRRDIDFLLALQAESLPGKHRVAQPVSKLSCRDCARQTSPRIENEGDARRPRQPRPHFALPKVCRPAIISTLSVAAQGGIQSREWSLMK